MNMENPIDISEYAPSTHEEFQEARAQLGILKKQNENKIREAVWLTDFIRPDILKFAYRMELTMRRNDREKGASWKTCEPISLCKKLDEESEEVSAEIYRFMFQRENTLDTELLDLANCCMMLWNRIVESKIKPEE